MINVSIDSYFFANLTRINTITTITAAAMNIPKPIPALKIPSIASQEVKKKERRSSVLTESGFIFFMIILFLNEIKPS